MNVTLTLTTEQLAYLMVAAFEGGSGYWCTRARPEPEDVSAFDAPWYSDKRFYEQDSWRVICTDTDDDGNDVEHPLTAETIAKGLAVIAEKYPFRLPAIFGDHDAEDADVFLQCCALGDIVYG